MKAIKIRDVMTSPALTVPVDATLTEAEAVMRTHHFRHLPVVEGGKLVGVISEDDFFRHVKVRPREGGFYFDPQELESFILRHVMTHDPVCVHADDPLIVAVGIMVVEKFGALPVVDDEKHVIGIISQIDILKLLHRVLSH